MLNLLRKPPTPPPPPRRDWYRDADPEDRREYDAFGPWVTEVKVEADMPRRFRFAWPRLVDAQMILKVPCNAERARMRPGMDLYITVLAIHGAGVTLMHWDGAKVTTREIVWDEIAVLKIETNLLVGHWTLLTRDGDSVALTYNTVSSRLLDRASSLIRARAAWSRSIGALPAVGIAVAVTDHLYRYMAMSMTRVGPQPVQPLHFEPQNMWCRTDRNQRRLTTGLLILDGPTELIVVRRNEPIKSLFTPNYSVVSIYIPHRRLTGFTFRRAVDGKGARFHYLVLETEGHALDVACLAPPETVLALLRIRGVPEH